MVETEAEKVARLNGWSCAFAQGYLDGRRDVQAQIESPISLLETTDYAHGYWRGRSASTRTA